MRSTRPPTWLAARLALARGILACAACQKPEVDPFIAVAAQEPAGERGIALAELQL